MEKPQGISQPSMQNKKSWKDDNRRQNQSTDTQWTLNVTNIKKQQVIHDSTTIKNTATYVQSPDVEKTSCQVAAVNELHNGYNCNGIDTETTSSHHLASRTESDNDAALFLRFPTFIKEKQLRQHIKKHGFGRNLVAIHMHFRKSTRTPAGSAKVLITPPNLIDQFISRLDGTCLPGKYQQLLSVQPYQLHKDEVHSCRVFVGCRLPSSISEIDVRSHFVKCKNAITSVQIERGRRDRCYAVVTFQTSDAAKSAVDNYHNSFLFGKQIKVEMYKQNRQTITSSNPEPVVVRYLTTFTQSVNDPEMIINQSEKSRLHPHNKLTLVSQNHSHSNEATNEEPKSNSFQETSPYFKASRSSVKHTQNNGTSKLPLAERALSLSVSSFENAAMTDEKCLPNCATRESDEFELNTATTVIIENLDPTFSQKELESLTGVPINVYTPSNQTPDGTAAWIEVSNIEDAHIIADSLNEKIISGVQIHCSLSDSSTLYKQLQSSPYSESLQENLPFMVDTSLPLVHKLQPSMPYHFYHYDMIMSQCLPGQQQNAAGQFMLPREPVHMEMKVISVKQGQWNILTAKQPDSTVLLEEFISPFTQNHGVMIQLQFDSYCIVISGASDVVNSAFDYISDQLTRHLYVQDRIKMSALVHLNPSFPQEIRRKHGIVISGYFESSHMIKLDGHPSNAVRAARSEIDGLLDKAIITRLKLLFAQSFFPLAQKQLELYDCRAYTEITNEFQVQPHYSSCDQNVAVCSFDKTHHAKAVMFFKKVTLTERELVIPFAVENDKQCIQQQLKQIESDYCVITDLHVVQEVHRFCKIVITGFCVSQVMNAHKSLIHQVNKLLNKCEKLSCKPEEVIYLTKVDGEGKQLLSHLSAQVNECDDEIELHGNPDCIARSKNEIFHGPLKDLKFRRFVFKCSDEFGAQIEHYILKPFMERCGLHFKYFIDMHESRRRCVQEPVPGEGGGFGVIIYSKDTSVLNEICNEMEPLNPTTQQFPLHCEEAILRVRKLKKELQRKHHVRLVIEDDNVITLHGLSPDEIQQSWKELDTDIRSTVEITKTIPLKQHECMYLENMHFSELKEQFTCIINIVKEIGSKMQSVSVKGKIQDVEAVCNKILDITGVNIQSVTFSIKCMQPHLTMWRIWWKELADKNQEENGVIIHLQNTDGQDGDGNIQVNFELIGTDTNFLRELQTTICMKDTEKRVVDVSQSSYLLTDLKKLPVFETLAVAYETNQLPNEIVLLSPKSLSIDLDIAETEVRNFLQKHTIITKELVCKDAVAGLILTSSTMSIKYIESATSIASSYNVKVDVFKAKSKVGIKLTGTSATIKVVEPLIQEKVFKEIERSLLKSQLFLPSTHKTVLSSTEFMQLEVELREKHCVVLSYPRETSNVVHSQTVKTQSEYFKHCIQLKLCYGNIVYEEVDAIVNATGEDLVHISDLAKFMVEYGGHDIQLESNQYVQSYGRVPPGKCVCLGAGDLSCKKVIHAVGPQWQGGKENEEKILYDMVYRCLQCADGEGLKSIAFPAIIADIFSMPEAQDVCARASLKAAHDYCQSSLTSNLKTICFVVHTPSILEHFSSTFTTVCKCRPTTVPEATTSLSWYWKHELGSYKPYPLDVSVKLTEEFQNNSKGSLNCTINDKVYHIDFPTMIQTNCLTGCQRSVEWKENQPASASRLKQCHRQIDRMNKSDSLCGNINPIGHHHETAEYQTLLTIYLHGPKQNLHQAKAELQEKLQVLYKSKILIVPRSLKERCCEVADMFSVVCSLDKENLRNKRRSKLVVQGLATDVEHVVTRIQEEVDENDSAMNYDEYPEEWEEFSKGENLQLVPVNRKSEEWNHIEQLFMHTMQCSIIYEIKRIQNAGLWSRFAFERKRLSKKNNGIIELELFHGTRENHPRKIYESETGFDMRYSRGGLWGQANYFAKKAIYSHYYAHKTDDGIKEMFLAKVLTGESCLIKPDHHSRKLRMPPPKSAESSRSGPPILFDTVHGYTLVPKSNNDRCKVFMTYDNDKAYPAYLIQYMYKS